MVYPAKFGNRKNIFFARAIGYRRQGAIGYQLSIEGVEMKFNPAKGVHKRYFKNNRIGSFFKIDIVIGYSYNFV